MNADQYIAVQLVAQDPGGDGKAAPPGGGILANPMTILIAIMIMFYFLVLRPNRKQEAERKAMIDSVKKNAKVVTIGGIVGTLVSVKKDEDEVTLKSANSQLRILRSSIARVIEPGEGEPGEESPAGGADGPDERIQRKD